MEAREIQKVIRDGKVAVLVSYGYGAGWYSWNTEFPQILFHPKLIELAESGELQKMNDDASNKLVQELLGIDIYTGGADGLRVEWLPVGTAFQIDEYDGAESLTTLDNLTLIA